jgi:D-arabinose 1-dehydrogenase-like Zn-dependent alcohol dehydrogenase
VRVAVLRAVGSPLSLEDWPDPTPAGDEVVVRIAGAGVCHTDVHVQDGLLEVPLPLVLGHEIAGVAEPHGPVLVFGSWGDGTCAFCARGDDPLCRPQPNRASPVTAATRKPSSCRPHGSSFRLRVSTQCGPLRWPMLG